MNKIFKDEAEYLAYLTEGLAKATNDRARNEYRDLIRRHEKSVGGEPR